MRHPAIVEALAAHEAFRRLHFASEQIFILLQGEKLFVLVQSGEARFTVHVGYFAATEDVLLAHWTEAVTAWNGSMTTVERDRIWENSATKKSVPALIVGLIAKGFSLQKADA